jgi:methyl-accepting chemotaxis protein
MTRGFVVLVCISLLAGCDTIKHPVDFSKLSLKKMNMGTGTTYRYDYKARDDCKAAAEYFRTKYEKAPDPNAQKAVRNRITYELLGLVDESYGHFVREFCKERDAKDILFKVTSLALTGTASLALEPTSQILAAIDTGLKGANEAIDRYAFRDNVTEVLINTMNADRSAVAAQIYRSMSDNVDKYPLEATIRDVVRYYNAGTITSALVSLREKTAQGAQNAAQEAQKAAQGTQNAVQGTQNAVQGAQNAAQGAQNAAQGAQNAAQGAQNAVQGTQKPGTKPQQRPRQ